MYIILYLENVVHLHVFDQGILGDLIQANVTRDNRALGQADEAFDARFSRRLAKVVCAKSFT